MTLALGIVFWICIIVIVVLYIAQRTFDWLHWVLLLIAVVALGIATFGGLHLVK